MTNYELLSKTLWSLDDICLFVGCKKTKASQILSAAKKISVSKFMPSKAKRDNVLKVLNIDFQEEIQKQKILNNKVEQNEN